MSQSNFFLSPDESRAILLGIIQSNKVLIFEGIYFEVEYPIPVDDINELINAENLVFWLKNDFVQPRAICSGRGNLEGNFLFNYYRDPIIEFNNCIWREEIISPGRIFYKAGWIENEQLRKLHKNWTARVSKLFSKSQKKIYGTWQISPSIEDWVLQGGLLELGPGGKLVGKEDI